LLQLNILRFQKCFDGDALNFKIEL
jgi:hypothetical protein